MESPFSKANLDKEMWAWAAKRNRPDATRSRGEIVEEVTEIEGYTFPPQDRIRSEWRGTKRVCGVGFVTSISVHGSMSATLASGSECTVPDSPFDISAETTTATCSDCVAGCVTEAVQMSFTCPSECTLPNDPDNTFQVGADLFFDGGTGHWTLSINIDIFGGFFCGQDYNDIGTDNIYELDLGEDPSGVQTLSFNDPEIVEVHYDVVVTIVL